MIYLIIANILGLISAICYWISNFKKDKKQIVRMHLICNISDLLQYICLYSPTAIIDTGITFIKNLVFVKTKTGKLAICFSILKCLCIILFGFEGIITIIAVILEITSILILVYLSEQWVRGHGIIKSIYWIFYDFTHKAIIASIMGIGSVVAISIAMFKNRNKEI